MFKTILTFLVGFMIISWVSGFFSGDSGSATGISQVMTISDVHVHVDDTSGFATSGYLMIQSEIVTYTGKTATTFTGLTRGVDNTVATSHPLISNGLRVKVYTEEIGAINSAMGFDAGAIMSKGVIIGIPLIIWKFFSVTLPMIILWDSLSWMTGMLAYIRALLVVITAGLIITLAIIGASNIVSAIKR